MQQSPGNNVPNASLPRMGQPSLLVEWQSGHRVFLDNLRDLFSGSAPQLSLTSRTAPFWPDVFVERPVAWRSMASSALYHVFGIVVVYAMSVTWAQRAPIRVHSPFDNSKITYYNVSEYLPEINTGGEPAPAKVEQKGQPRWAKQRIISIPPAPDNFRQTIITPSQIKLPNAVAMPNLVAWTPIPSPVPEAAITSQMKLPALTPEVVAPAPSTEALRARSAAPMQPEVVAPPPSLDAAKSKSRLPNIPEPSVVEPPVNASAASRPLGAMNVARMDPTVAEPKLPVPEQHVASAGSAGSGAPRGNAGGSGQGRAVQAAPDVAGLGNGKRAVGQLIALGLDPAAVGGPINVPGGSRYGQFATTPEGNPNAPGTPDLHGGGTNGGGGAGAGSNGGGSGRGSGPPGISVGPGPAQPNSGVVAQGDPLETLKRNAAAKPTTMASLERPRMADIGRSSRPSDTSVNAPSRIEDKVFGAKRYYSMTLNMPNLTSAGGSWIIRFAELNETAAKGDVTAPQAMVKVDPAYPQDLMRDRVEGTVMLYAVIHKDGTVGEVKVLRGLEERLDENAKVALSRWKFHPAMKNGSAVDLEAVVQIPFAVKRLPF